MDIKFIEGEKPNCVRCYAPANFIIADDPKLSFCLPHAFADLVEWMEALTKPIPNEPQFVVAEQESIRRSAVLRAHNMKGGHFHGR